MFGKTAPRQQMDKKKHGTAYYAAMIFTVVIEFALGTNAAFLMYQNFKVTIYALLQVEGWAVFTTVVLAFAFGVGIFLGGMWTFAGFIDNLDDAKAYSEYHGIGDLGGTHWPEALLYLALVLVMALDLTTLLFRSAYFSEKGATALFLFFCVLIVLPPVLGPLIHVLENTPRNRREAKIRQRVERLDVDSMESALQTMDHDLRSRILSNDPNDVKAAWAEYYARVADTRQANYDLEQQRMRDKKMKQSRKNKGFIQPEEQDQQSPLV